MKCAYCGKETPDGLPNCVHCGHPFTPAQVQAAKQAGAQRIVSVPVKSTKTADTEAQKKQKIVVIVIASVLTMALVIGGIVGITMKVRSDRLKKFETQITTQWQAAVTDKQPDFLDALDKQASLTCTGAKKQQSGYYTVTVQVTSPDISGDLKKYQAQKTKKSVSDSDMDQAICKMIENATPKTTTQTVDVIVDDAGEYHVQFNDAFANAMLGYAYTDAMQALTEALK